MTLAPFTDTFESGTLGSAPPNSVTTGTATVAMSLGTGTAATLDNTQVHGGSMSMKLAYSAGASAAGYRQYSVSSTGRFVYDTWRYVVPAASTAATYLGSIRSGTSNMCSFYLAATTGKFAVTDAAGSGIAAATSSSAIPTSAWVRIRVAVTPGSTTSNGTIEYSITDASNNVLASWSSSAQNTGTSDVTAMRVGSTVTPPQAATDWVDDVTGYNTASGWSYVPPSTPPNESVTVQTGWAIIDATGVLPGDTGTTPGTTGDTVTYSIAQTSGTTSSPVQVASGVWAVKQASVPLGYTVTATEGTAQSTATATVPVSSSSGGYLQWNGTAWV